MDVASYYPNLIINNKFYPEHLGEDFITVLKRITNERLKAKASGDKVKADGLKITINSIFGKLGLEQFWLLDPKQLLSTTVSGQLGLLMLIEDLHENGINVISANTDGVVCKIPRKLESAYYEVAKRWEEKTGLSLEYTAYKKYVRRDVNSYITEKEDGSTKEKGLFLKKVDLKKAYKMPIVSKALYHYFINGTPVKETLESCTDIMEFCISQKTGSNFILEHHTTDGVEKLQKTNRYFLSKKGGLLIKRDIHSGKTTSLHVGKTAKVLNNYDPSVPFDDYEVDLAFYEKEVMKAIDSIEPKQMRLFDMGSVSGGTMTKAEVVYVQEEVKDLSVQEINKLGKNQLIKKIESIVENGGKITGISPRYIYITNFDAGTMTADMYSLGKGVRASVVVDKKAYKELRIEQGQLVFCSKFNKTQNGHVLIEYKITDKIEEERQTLL
jgi:hypothetical protein